MSGREAEDRRRTMLRTAMGPAIAAALADPLVIEVMVNPDGVLRLDRLGEGRVETGERIDTAQVERIIRLVASHARSEVHAASPIVSAELPPHAEGMAGERFNEGVCNRRTQSRSRLRLVCWAPRRQQCANSGRSGPGLGCPRADIPATRTPEHWTVAC